MKQDHQVFRELNFEGASNTRKAFSRQPGKLGITSVLQVFLLTVLVAFSNAVYSQNTEMIPAVLGVLLDDECTASETVDGVVTLVTQEDVDALDNVAIISGFLRIDSNTDLDLSPLRQLVEVGGISMTNNTVQTSISGFDCLELIGKETPGGLLLNNNSALLEVSGFKRLKSMTGVFWIKGSPSIEKFDGFDNFMTAGSTMEFGPIPKLSSIPSFGQLESIGEDLILLDLESLEEISGFAKLRMISESLLISRSKGLKEISGFDQLIEVNGDFNISENTDLERISGFDMLQAAGITGVSSVSINEMLDCRNPLPTFTPVVKSFQNFSNCPQLGKTFVTVDVEGDGSNVNDVFGMFYAGSLGAGTFGLTEAGGGQTFEGISDNSPWTFQQETFPIGYSLSDISCISNRVGASFDVSLPNRSVDFPVFIDETVECVFKNENNIPP